MYFQWTVLGRFGLDGWTVRLPVAEELNSDTETALRHIQAEVIVRALGRR